MEASRAHQDDAGQAQQVADQAREKVGEAADQAKETAQNVVSQAQTTVREQVDQRSTEAGERVGTTAEDVRSVGQELRKQGKDAPANIADQVADRVDRVAGYLRDADGERILNDVEDFGRRQPWAVLAGAVVVGMAAARFLKASSRERYGSRQNPRTFTGYGSPSQLSGATAPTPDTGTGADRTEPVAAPAGVR
ncbi:MAG TPA: hypothetical protein VI035_03455 [Solirubrobacterales bacterium]